jgi:hypothetical protein
MAIVGVDGAL